MKNHTGYQHRTVLVGLFLIACAILYAGPASAAEEAVPRGEVSITGALRTGEPVTAVFDLKDYAFPIGTSISVNVRFRESPDAAPKIRPGYPETIMEFPAPGTYHATFILNEIRKCSCGGVEARLLMERSVDIIIAP